MDVSLGKEAAAHSTARINIENVLGKAKIAVQMESRIRR